MVPLDSVSKQPHRPLYALVFLLLPRLIAVPAARHGDPYAIVHRQDTGPSQRKRLRQGVVEDVLLVPDKGAAGEGEQAVQGRGEQKQPPRGRWRGDITGRRDPPPPLPCTMWA